MGDLHIAITAKKDIKMKEELLINYDVDYWRSHNEKV
jgi:SET domain-containing protein